MAGSTVLNQQLRKTRTSSVMGSLDLLGVRDVSNREMVPLNNFELRKEEILNLQSDTSASIVGSLEKVQTFSRTFSDVFQHVPKMSTNVLKMFPKLSKRSKDVQECSRTEIDPPWSHLR